ncbi:hypothetical protein CAI21_18615 [Alkalilimnicola ehrlichii]|uniref:Cytochrome c domain-containing protein n=1 Tax=Alkalilimnicola ehrlichii TaxID=351052 RepID=A0A3E0WL91_9GAMM|nr:c-type cytochrome [Alkalilimnicola ehrlichii]RFA25777.1 hypothetical protein CAI21_18615 [Alkalilimnicola ehrlichii]RFA32857.1 hypothetical protein CAL65_18865 [Alkalilimnicola ehrlichii]
MNTKFFATNAGLKRFLTALSAAGLFAFSQSSAHAQQPRLDSMQQRVQPCIACHDASAIDLQSGYVPRLHGKPAGYLFNQLINYQEGRRHHAPMEHMVNNLSPEYLWEMAEYFSRLDEAQTPPAEPAADAALRERGEELVFRGDPERGLASCQACHGERLTGVEPNTPSLLGLPSHYISAQLGAWRTGRRQAAEPDCMQEIAQAMSPRDIQAVARWLAALPVPEDSSADPEPAAELPMECGSVPRPEYAS